MHCAHCFRGNAQNVDLSHESIDALLNQTERIKFLVFTGGEPSMNIEGMRYFLDGCIKRNILIRYLNLTINGSVQSNEFVQLMIDYNDWIGRYPVNHESRLYKSHIDLWISKDRFHKDGVSDEAYEYYAKALKDYPSIKVIQHEIPNYAVHAIGRARELKDTALFPPHDIRATRIEMLNQDTKCYCPYRQYERLPQQTHITRVLCPIYISALGVCYGGFHTIECTYEDMDALAPKICACSEPIYERVNAYNRRPVALCVQEGAQQSLRDLFHDAVQQNIMDAVLSSYFPRNQIEHAQQRISQEYDERIRKTHKLEKARELLDEFLTDHPEQSELMRIQKHFKYLYLDELESLLHAKEIARDSNEDPKLKQIADDTIKSAEQLNRMRGKDYMPPHENMLHADQYLSKNMPLYNRIKAMHMAKKNKKGG